MTRILVVEDEESFSEALAYLLGKEGFDVVVADTGTAAVELFDKHGADLVLLDLMLPGLSGTEVCKQLRTRSAVPIIMLTAKDAEIDKVIARIRAVLRRHSDLGEITEDNGSLVAGPVRMDVDRHQVSVNNISISLPLKEFELLEFLMRNSGRVLTRMQLIDRVWGSDYVGDTKTLDVHIKRLRAKIEADPANPVFIQTVRGLGYKLEA
jgi:two-component system response regulator RegX3